MSFLSSNQNHTRSGQSADKENLIAKSNLTNDNNKNASSSSNTGRTGMGRTLSRSNSALQTKSSNFIVFPKQNRKDDQGNSNDNYQNNQLTNRNDNGKNENKGKLMKFNSMNNIGSSSGIGLGIGLDTLTEDKSEIVGGNKLNIQLDQSLRKKPQELLNTINEQQNKLVDDDLPKVSKSSKLLKDLQQAAVEEENDDEGIVSFGENDLSLDMDISFGFNRERDDNDDDSIEYVPHVQDPEISYIPNNAMPLRKNVLEEVFGKVHGNFDTVDLFANEKDIDPEEEKKFLSIGNDIKFDTDSKDEDVLQELDTIVRVGQRKTKDDLFDEEDKDLLAVNLDFNYDDALPYKEESSKVTEELKSVVKDLEKKSATSNENDTKLKEKRIPSYLASTEASRNKRYKPKRI